MTSLTASTSKQYEAKVLRHRIMDRLSAHVRGFFSDMNLPAHQTIGRTSSFVEVVHSQITAKQITKYTITIELNEEVI